MWFYEKILTLLSEGLNFLDCWNVKNKSDVKKNYVVKKSLKKIFLGEIKKSEIIKV